MSIIHLAVHFIGSSESVWINNRGGIDLPSLWRDCSAPSNACQHCCKFNNPKCAIKTMMNFLNISVFISDVSRFVGSALHVIFIGCRHFSCSRIKIGIVSEAISLVHATATQNKFTIGRKNISAHSIRRHSVWPGAVTPLFRLNTHDWQSQAHSATMSAR